MQGYDLSKPLFNQFYDEVRISIGAPCDILQNTRLEVAERIIRTIESSGNQLLNKSKYGITLFESSESVRRGSIGSFRKLLPGKMKVKNLEDIQDLEDLVPGVTHYRTSNPFRLDNPTTGLAYGGLIGLGKAISDHSSATDSPEMLGATLVEEWPVIKLGLSLGFIAGGAGMLYFRNKIVKDRSDPENARIWDSTQFLDMIVYFARQGKEVLSNLHGKEYPLPEYSNLPTGRFSANKFKAFKNLRSNPFIEFVGVKVVDKINA